MFILYLISLIWQNLSYLNEFEIIIWEYYCGIIRMSSWNTIPVPWSLLLFVRLLTISALFTYMLCCFFSSLLFMIRHAVVNDVDQQLCGVDDLALICTVNWNSYKSLSCPFLFCFPSKKAFQLWWKFWILQETTIREDFVHSHYFDVVYLCYLFILAMR